MSADHGLTGNELADFIDGHASTLLADCIAFARSMESQTQHLSQQELLDSVDRLLTELASNMRSRQLKPQSEHEATDVRRAAAVPAKAHAETRLAQGFALNQMVAEYTALRRNVIQHWSDSLRLHDKETFAQLRLFQDTVDDFLEEAAAHYSARLAQLRELFVGVLAHDLRTPLGAIDASAEYIRRAAQEDKCQDAADRIQRSAHRMQQMVADLLALTRSRLGQGVPLELAEVDLVTIFQQAAAEIGAISRDHEVRISIEGDAKGLWDAGRLAQVVSNLLGNAVRHGKPGGVIEINIDGKDYENVWFSVSNEGQPIPVELLPSLFEPLVRSKQNVPGSVTGAGLGLGLFIAEQIVVSHNGDIKVESGNERTVFEVCLPRKVRVPRPVERPSTH